MRLDGEVERFVDERLRQPFCFRNGQLQTPLVLVAAAARGNPAPLLAAAQAQFGEEFPKYGVTAPHEQLDLYGLLNCFGTVFLAHEMTGKLEREVDALRPLVERVVAKSGGDYDAPARAYLATLYGGTRSS